MTELIESSSSSNNIVTIPIGTPLCHYPSGTFTSQPQGDKCVLFAFMQNQPEATAVFYNQKLMSLADAIQSISFSCGSLQKSTRLLYGHEVHLYKHGRMDVIPIQGSNTIFVPTKSLFGATTSPVIKFFHLSVPSKTICSVTSISAADNKVGSRS